MDDLPRAQKFYRNAFSWKMDSMPGMGYVLVKTAATDENGRLTEPGAINGGMLKRTNCVKSPVITVNVENIDETVANVKENGGKIVMEKFRVGEMGHSAYIEDTEGNVIGLWQDLEQL